jgi:tRNA pseudouridine synthase 10
MKRRTDATVKSILRQNRLCVWCLGRQYASSQSEIEEAGLKAAARLGIVPSENCKLCGNAFKRKGEIENKVIREIGQIEFSTFQVGVTLSNDSVEREDEMRSRLRLSSGISLKKGLTIMFRRELAERLRKKPSLRNPEMTVKIGLPEGSVHVECKPVTIYVEYLKLERKVPVKAAPCHDCRGVGCETCGGTGIEREDGSVEAVLTDTFLEAFQGRKVKISWSGIEDESSLLLGNGRPAYVEVTSPTRRRKGLIRLNMAPARDIQLTRAELAPLDRSRIEDLAKEVFVTADFESELRASDVQLLEQAYREKDLTVTGDRKGRPRRVYKLEVVPFGKRAKMHLLLDNGISLKQLLAVKVDSEARQGRAQPTFADLLPANRVVAAESDVVRFQKTNR